MNMVSAHYLSQVIDSSASAGVERKQLISCVPGGEAGLSDPMMRHDCQVLLDIYEVGARAISDPSIGMLAGSYFNTSVLNQTGKILPMCETFGQAVSMLQRYHKLTQSFAVSKLEINGDEAAIVWYLNVADYQKYHRATEAFFTGITAGARWLLWNIDQTISHVSFRHDCPSITQRYEEAMGCAVLFNHDRDALVFSRDLLDMPLPGSNPEGLLKMSRSLDRMLIKVQENEAIVDRVCASIRDQLHDGTPEFEKTANDVGISISNLRYRLKLQQTTFRQLVEMVRKEICQFELSRSRKMYIIAQKLGFHDQAAFNRAFKKWYGISPKSFVSESQ